MKYRIEDQDGATLEEGTLSEKQGEPMSLEVGDLTFDVRIIEGDGDDQVRVYSPAQ